MRSKCERMIRDKIFFVLDAKVRYLDMAGGKPAPFPGMSTVKTIQTIVCLNAYIFIQTVLISFLAYGLANMCLI